MCWERIFPWFLNYQRFQPRHRSSSKTKACKFFGHSFSTCNHWTSASKSSSVSFGNFRVLPVPPCSLRSTAKPSGPMSGRLAPCHILDDGCWFQIAEQFLSNLAFSAALSRLPFSWILSYIVCSVSFCFVSSVGYSPPLESNVLILFITIHKIALLKVLLCLSGRRFDSPYFDFIWKTNWSSSNWFICWQNAIYHCTSPLALVAKPSPLSKHECS